MKRFLPAFLLSLVGFVHAQIPLVFSGGSTPPGAPSNLYLVAAGQTAFGTTDSCSGVCPAPTNANTLTITWTQCTAGAHTVSQNRIYRSVNGAGFGSTPYQTISAATSYVDSVATAATGVNFGSTGPTTGNPPL